MDHNELLNDIKDNSKLSEDAVFRENSMKVTDKVHVRRLSVKKRRLSSAPSESDFFQRGDRKFSIQSALSLYSLKAIQNDVREIETDLTEVCYGCYTLPTHFHLVNLLLCIING